MQIVRTVSDLRWQVATWRNKGERIALVPTMGALHEGHLSLVRQAREMAERVVVSLFVNPKQFGVNEDFSRYPRDEAADAALLESEGAELLYAPGVEDIYPTGFATTVSVAGLGDRWEGEIRPGHFAGMATVVTKLLVQAMPDAALFGEKDYQQLQIIKRLALDLNLPMEIVGCPTIRDEQGLALSSRNAYLDLPALQTARDLNRLLQVSVSEAQQNPLEFAAIAAGAAEALHRLGFKPVDYVAFCDPDTLEPLAVLDRPARLIAAARLGQVRLLDNFPVSPVE